VYQLSGEMFKVAVADC